MAKKSLPSPDVLRQLLRYEPETGKLFWRERGPEWFISTKQCAKKSMKSWNVKFSQREALTFITPDGYRKGAVLGLALYAHRVVWAVKTGNWPINEVDHIDGNPTNNAWSNLRQTTSSENSRNRKRCVNNTSGVMGVKWNKRLSKWVADIAIGDGKRKHLGVYSSFHDAVVSRRRAEKEFGYHKNHGRE